MAIIGILAGAMMINPTSAATTTANPKASNITNSLPQGQGISGAVTAISGTTITMTSKAMEAKKTTSATAATTYTVDASGATVEKGGTASSLSAINVGDTIMVEGTISGTSVKAKTIRLNEIDKNSTFGAVTAISGTTITMTSKPMANKETSATAENAIIYTVDASKATVTKNGTASAVSDIAVGDTIVVKGTISGTTITATSIQNNQGKGLETQGTGEPVVSGTVSAISGNTITITTKTKITYTVDASNAKIKKNNADATISGVAVGDTIMVQGTFSGTSVTATSITDQGASVQKSKGNVFSNVFSAFRKLFGF